MATEDSDLKYQFQQLQEQQQQKLMERRKRKEAANKNKRDAEEISGKFGVQDNLDLKLADPPEKGYGYVSEELVDHLNNEIRQIKDENGRLYKLLSERDFEVRQLKKKNEMKKDSEKDIHVTNETAATKIIELSKRVRELTSEKEAEKTKCKQFQKKYHDLQIQFQSSQSVPESSSMMGSTLSLRTQQDNRDNDGVDVKALQDRLKQTEAKVSDFRNQCQQLRQELKVAHKVMSQEIGETVNLQSLLNETSNWRGRAQQIIALQQKVDELKVQLESQGIGSGDKVTSGRKKQEEKYRDELRRMERERKEAQENASAKLKSLETEHESLKNKLDAAKTRCKVLSNEIKGLKPQVQTLLKKSRNDDEFIEALLKQQNHLKSLLEEHTQLQSQQQQHQQQQLQQMSMKSQQDSNIVEQLKAIAGQKEAQVKMLEMELQHIRMMHTQNPNLNAAMPQSTPVVVATLDSRPTTASDADTLTARSRDLTQSAMGSARTVSRSSNRSRSALGTENTGQVPGQASQAGEKQVTELTHLCEQQEVMRRAAEVERDKMTELVHVLQARLGAESQRLSDLQTDLQTQKRRAVELEKQLGRQHIDVKKRAGGQAGMSARDGEEDEVDDDGDGEKNELRTRLEIQKDENEALKASLQRILKAKDEDLQLYSCTLEETKKVFLQALKQMKEKQQATS